jgi:AcrR family transcriptional regulator
MGQKTLKTKPKRVRRAPAEARQLILDAAVRVLSKQGPDAVGLKQVAAEAGVSHALVVHYFGSYKALVEATLGEAGAKLRARMLEGVQAVANPSVETLLLVYLDAALEPWYGRLVSWSLMREQEGVIDQAAQLVPDMKMIVDMTQQLLASRASVPPTRDETEMLIALVWSMTMGYVAGREFIWRALGHRATVERDRAVRDSLAGAARTLFGDGTPTPAPAIGPTARARRRPRSR